MNLIEDEFERAVRFPVSSRQLQVQECSSDDDDHHDYNLLHNSTRRILSSSSTTTTTTTNSNELRSSRTTAAACIAAAVTASLYDETNAMEISRHSTTIVESSDDSDEEEEDDDDDEEEEEETSANILFCPTPSSVSLSSSTSMLADQVKQDSLVQLNTNQFRPIPQPIPVPMRPVTYPSSYLSQQQYHPSQQHQQPPTVQTAVPSNYPRQFLSSRRNPYPTHNSTNSACSCSHRTPSTSTVITPSNGSNGPAATSMSPFILYPPNQTSNVIPTLAATTHQTVALAAAAASAGKFKLIFFCFFFRTASLSV